MAEEEGKGLIIDRDDWIWYVLGGLSALVALFLIKNILEPSQNHYHNHHHQHPHHHPVPISKHVDKVYRTDYEGKLY